MADTTDWKAVTNFFNEVIEDANDPMSRFLDDNGDLTVTIYSAALDQTLKVVIPHRLVEDFMKSLPMYEALIERKS